MRIPSLVLLLITVSAIPVAAESSPSTEPEQVVFSAALSGTFKGLLRYSAQYRDSNLHTTQDNSSDPPAKTDEQLQYSAAGGYFGYETAPWFNTSIGATLYTGLPFFAANCPADRRGLAALDEDEGRQDAYLALGEAYIKVQTDSQRIVIGRQEMPGYLFVDLSDIRISPLTHEGIRYENHSLADTRLNFAYITRQKDRNSSEFEDMARSARVRSGCGTLAADGSCLENGSKNLLRGNYTAADFDAGGDYSGADKSLGVAAITYSANGLSLEGWEYYAEDFINTLYLYTRYSFKPTDTDLQVTAAGQYASQQDVGDQIAGNVDTWFYGLKLQASSQGLTCFTSFNEVSYNENSYDGGTIFVRWGTPPMFNSFQVQDSELGGVRSLGGGLQYDFGANGLLPGTLVRIRHAYYNMPDDLSQRDARQDRTETTLDVRYSFEKDSGFGLFDEIPGLSIFFRLAYNNYKTDYDFTAYKTIHNYSFDTVTDDFLDYRLYIDYKF